MRPNARMYINSSSDRACYSNLTNFNSVSSREDKAKASGDNFTPTTGEECWLSVVTNEFVGTFHSFTVLSRPPEAMTGCLEKTQLSIQNQNVLGMFSTFHNFTVVSTLPGIRSELFLAKTLS